MSPSSSVFGVIIGNRDFFPDHLVAEARTDILRLFEETGNEAVLLDPADTKLGGVETHAEARKCAEQFRRERDRIDGVLVVLPNFGDEKGVADTLRIADLNVPLLIQAYPDDLDRLDVVRRRDAFCGKISVQQPAPGRHAVFSYRQARVAAVTTANAKQVFNIP